MYNQTINSTELYHFGTKGQKWGTRHWQNPDGTFNEAGKKRYFGVGRSLAIRAKDHQLKKKRKAALEKARQVKADKKKAAEEEAKKNPLAKYSLQELKDMNARMQEEITYNARYNQLHPAKKSLGKVFVDATLEKMAKDTLPTIINTTLKTEGIKYVNKVIADIQKKNNQNLKAQEKADKN